MKNKNYDKVAFTAIENIKSSNSRCGVVSLNSFYSLYSKQKVSWEQNGLSYTTENKFKQFAIQPQMSGKRCKLDELQTLSQVVFIDIDSKPKNVANTDLEGISDKIMEYSQKIMNDSPFIFIQQSISGGVHVIAYIDELPATIDEYKAKARLLTAYFCKRVKDVFNVDLTSVKDVVDTHNFSPVQCFLVSPTPMAVNVHFKGFKFGEQISSVLKEMFPTIFEEEKKEKESKANKADKEYAYTEIDETVSFQLKISKESFDFHLGDTERFMLATSLKTLVSTKSIPLNIAKAIYAKVINANSVKVSGIKEQMAKFDEVMSRKNIKPIVCFQLLEDVGIYVTSIYNS